MTPGLRRIVVEMARLAWCGWWWATAIVLLLAAVPFTAVQLLQAQLIPGLDGFVRLHVVLGLAAAGAWSVSIVEDFARHRTAASVAIAAAFAAVMPFVWMPVASLMVQPAPHALGAAIAAAFAPCLALPYDWWATRGRLYWMDVGAAEDRRLLLACVAVALLLAAVSTAIARTLVPDAAPIAVAAALAHSLVPHVTLALCLFAALSAIRAIGAWTGGFARVEFVLAEAAAAAIIAVGVYAIPLRAMSFAGAPAMLCASAAALSLASTGAALALRLRASIGGLVESGIELAVSPGAASPRAPRWLRAAAVMIVPLLAIAAAAAWSRVDWNGTLRTLSAFALIAVAFAALYRAIDVRPGLHDRTTAQTLVAGLAAVILVGAAQQSPQWFLPPASAARLAAVDASAGAIASLRRSTADADDPAFYEFLRRSTNLPQNATVSPARFDMVPAIGPPVANRPDIFIFVIDSLRQDYVSAYNPKVTFTPNIDAWSRDAIVFRNAFTRYGATGLAEPSIWTGAQIVHKQYVEPFAPMNTLQRLIKAQGYQTFASVDVILRAILEPDFVQVPLEADVSGRDFSLCRAVADLETKLDARRADPRPVFAYTQPQSIHIATIAREGASVPPSESYPGFYAPYASRLRALDGCFGSFIEYLKASRRYENSVVVLTSDHGDSLGEDGRMGHAYTLFPEILRIPLIVSLPERFRGLAVDRDRVAFNMDLSPTLYYLLGQHPVAVDPLFGRPLLTETAAEQQQYRRDAWLEASSYGPVYAVLDGGGRSLVIADAINYRDYAYALSTSGDHAVPLAPADAAAAHARIRADVAAVNTRFGFTPPR